MDCLDPSPTVETLYSRDTSIQGTQKSVQEKCSHNLCICYLLWRNISIQGKRTHFMGPETQVKPPSRAHLSIQKWLGAWNKLQQIPRQNGRKKYFICWLIIKKPQANPHGGDMWFSPEGVPWCIPIMTCFKSTSVRYPNSWFSYHLHNSQCV